MISNTADMPTNQCI